MQVIVQDNVQGSVKILSRKVYKIRDNLNVVFEK